MTARGLREGRGVVVLEEDMGERPAGPTAGQWGLMGNKQPWPPGGKRAPPSEAARDGLTLVAGDCFIPNWSEIRISTWTYTKLILKEPKC